MRNPKNMLIVGIVLLVIGVCILLFNPDQSAANLEIARNAKNAQEAAAAISGNNQRELMIHMAGNFLAGIGIALTAGSFFDGKSMDGFLFVKSVILIKNNHF